MARRPGWPLAAYRLASRALPLLAPALLRRRLRGGKEEAGRWREKLGEASLPRPEGPLVWLHAVGLGEVLALRGLITTLAEERGDLDFLITSTARSSAEVIGGQLPPRCRHQFLPVDAPLYLRRFLAHWRPDLSVWAEQDLWPNAVLEADRAGIPLALVNARMNAAAFARRKRARGLYGDLLSRFALIAAQDEGTARHLTALGATRVEVTGSLKASAPPLACDEGRLQAMREALRGRTPWLLASSHPEDEAVALAAQARLCGADPAGLLIIAPRDPHRGGDIAEKAATLGLAAPRLSAGEAPERAPVWIADSFGAMGLWYRLCPVSLIGGTFGPTEGHNPWEPAALGSAILHGPRVANFAHDFARLSAARATMAVAPETLEAALGMDHSAMAARARALWQGDRDRLRPLARALIKAMA